MADSVDPGDIHILFLFIGKRMSNVKSNTRVAASDLERFDYCISGNIGGELNLAVWQLRLESPH